MHHGLPAGLHLRPATTDDAEVLAAFHADVLRGQDAPEPSPAMAAWGRDLLSGHHPTFDPEDALMVEDAGTGALVAAAMLVGQTVRYGDVELPVGQPELIGTRPADRGRGIVRALMARLHARSAERGHVAQLIAGIPWFYRQFGYELAVPRGGGPLLRVELLPTARADLPYRVRPMRAADLAFAVALDRRAAQRYLLTVPRGERLWRWELEGRHRDSAMRSAWSVLETHDGAPVGVASHHERLDGTVLSVTSVEVAAGVSWRSAWDTLGPHWREVGAACAARGGKPGPSAVSFWWLHREHPLFHAVRFTEWQRPAAVYARVPDVPAFLGRIAPVLERRLAASVFAGHTGELRLGFYRDGVRLVFEGGRVEHVEAWRQPADLAGQEQGFPSRDPRRAHALFPDLTVLQILFGLRALEELEAAFPDCLVRGGETRGLLAALFPKQPSDYWPVL
jgi:hypothetical protein